MSTTRDCDLPVPQSRLHRMLRSVGVARPAASREATMFETLENRVLLGGDHPSFELPLTPMSGTFIDVMSGSASDSGIIEDTTPELSDDLFRFVAPADDFVRIWADTVNPGSSLDSRVEVYNLAGQLLASGSSQGTLTAGTFTDGWAGFVAEENETYFVRVMSDQMTGAAAVGQYEIRIDTLSESLTVQTNPTPPPGQPRYGFGSADGQLTLVGGDVVYKLTVPSAAAFDSLATFYATNPTSVFDPRVDIYDAQGRLIKGDSETGRLNAAFLAAPSAPDKVFYIRVRGDEFDLARSQSTGEFTIKADTRAIPIEMDPITRRGIGTGALPDGYDTRLFTFEAQGTGLTIITVRGIPLPPLLDPAIRLYNEQGALLGFDRIGAELQIQLQAGERYYVVVEEFDLGAGGVFAAWIESNHTVGEVPGTEPETIDDHVSIPEGFDPDNPTEEDRRIFEQATPIVWQAPDFIYRAEPPIPGVIFPFQDINPIADRSYTVTGQGTGRIFRADDTDLFQFVPPVDMLGTYGGNNDDSDTPLFIGGAGSFTLKTTSGPPDYDPRTENFLSVWEAMDYWELQAGVTGTVRAMIEFDWGGDEPALVIAGEFTSANYTPMSFITAWWFNPMTEAYEFADLGGGLDNFVHALHTYEFEDEDNDSLIAGGEFTGHIARYLVPDGAASPAEGSWEVLAGGLPDTVYAITDYDPPDPEMGTENHETIVAGGEFGLRWLIGEPLQTMGVWGNVFGNDINGPAYALEVWTPEPAMGEDELPQLMIGGDFSMYDGVAVNNMFALSFDPEFAMGVGAPVYDPMGGGTNDTVYALTLWDRDGGGEDFRDELIVGGAFTDRGGRIASWNGAWAPLGLGMPPGFNNTVRSLIAFQDEEFGIGLGPFDENPVVYAGGDFTTADGRQAQRVARLEFNELAMDWEWLPMPQGSTGTVYALQNFNDNTEAEWDRGERTAARLNIVVSPAFGGGANMFVRVYDSNLELIYEGNDTIAPGFPDPAGMVDPASVGPEAELDDFEGIEVWGGEVYYLEVGSESRGAGRYTVSIRADAAPPDTTGNFLGDDVIGSFRDPVGIPALPESDFADALGIDLLDMSTGDGRNFIADPRAAHTIRTFEPTPAGLQFTELQELGVIHSIDDVDIYRFRAPADGTIEIRIATHQLLDEFTQIEADLVEGTEEVTTQEKRYNSPLDAYLRVFGNDFVELAANDNNEAFAGEIIEQVVGSFGVDANQGVDPDTGEPLVRQFRSHDPRVVIPIVSGETYFIVVQSGQYFAQQNEPGAVDWRRAIGSYELLLNALPQLQFEDDYPDFTAATVASPFGLPSGAVIPLDPTTGMGSITGEIVTKVGPTPDSDQFAVQAVQDGIMRITASPLPGSVVTPSFTIYDGAGQEVGSATAPPGGVANLEFSAGRGDLFYIVLEAANQGAYRIDVSAATYVDDNSSLRFDLATELEIMDFTGTAGAMGVLEDAGDIDLFRFETPGFDLATISVTSLSPGFDPLVRVYEVSEDPAGNPIFLKIADNDNANPTTVNALAQFTTTAPDRTSLLTGNTYNSYFVLVGGADPTADSGAYQLTLSVTPTDDHPDQGEFSFATPITFDTITGEGSDTGVLEIDEDSDLFTFQAAAGGQATVTVTATEDLRPTLLVLDQSFNPVEHKVLGTTTPVEGPDALGSSATYVFDVVRGQRYYILVDGVLGGMVTQGVGSYELDVLAPIVDDHPNESEFSLASEIVLNQITGAGGVSALITPHMDTDLFFFRTLAKSTPSEPGDHEITLDARAGGFDPILTVFNAAQTPVALITDNGPGDEDATIGVVTYTAQSVARGELFYLLVDAADGAAVTTGSYRMDVIGPPPGLPDPNPDDDHANEGQFTAATLINLDERTGGGTDSGIIEISGDTDLFRFVAITDGDAFVQVVTPSGTLLDTRLTVYERRSATEFAPIDTDTVGIPGANSFSQFQTLAAGTEYYLLVQDVSDGRGAYTVEIATEPETFYLYFPEGFAGDDIREFVSFTNPDDTRMVTYDVVLYYENPDLAPSRLVSGGTLAPGARGGLTISDAGNVFGPGVHLDEAYAIVIESDGILGATFAHYDFGAAIGESFTSRTSETWSFARVERSPGAVEDFLVYYNPNNHDVRVTLTAFSETGDQVTLQQVVQANRRGGWSIDDMTQLPLGVFSVRLTSEAASTIAPGDEHIGIVASLSHFDVARGTAFAVLGDAEGGSTLSVIPHLEFGDGKATEVTLFNPSSTPTAVTITGTYTQAAFEDTQTNLTIPAGSFVTLSGADLGLIRNQPLGMRFESVRPVTVTATQTERGDTSAIQAVSDTARTWFFGDAFINSAQAGDQYFETISLYNPAGVSIAVDINLYFNDGSSLTTTLTVGADDFAEFRLHEFTPLLQRPEMLNFFSVELEAASPFIVQMEHFDLFLDGGWGASGAPLGLLNPLSRIG